MSYGETINLQVNAIGNFSNVIGEVNKLKSQLSGLKLPKNMAEGLEKGLNEVESKYAKFQSLASKGINTKSDFNSLVKSAKDAERAIDSLKQKASKIGDKEINFAIANDSDLKAAEQNLQKILKLNAQLKSFGTKNGVSFFSDGEVAKMEKIANSSKGLEKRFSAVSNAFKAGDIKQADAALEELIAHAEKYGKLYKNNEKVSSKWGSVSTWAKGAKSQLETEIAEVKRAEKEYEKLKIEKEKALSQGVSNFSKGIGNVGTGMQQEIANITQAASKTQQLNDQISVLKNQANYFFGLQNVGRLIGRGFREAAESVRDLDKAMTETAVVTEYSVQDMWEKLPEYTKLANELGATTQGAYETMTLYYQQGLNTQEAFAVGTETMKMARIAGLDYAQTTNMMTAALRGFNMEINEVSAQRVNDVYSKLAAVTASDTRELGLAMERTASIAHSANMDFGNTTAFLAQMIETTREAPENLGTALKTIIARFQELKENPYKISEVDGEEVDFNRVDKALKSIGVDLMDNKDKFRDLDDVFMDISEKWDGLSQTQQRYVATIAAGARQQSRFLAMVGNYDRLKQLTDAAANSEGAAQVQFDKTLDSYEAKMNKLKNAWQGYTMSIANNKVVKGIVDLLQTVISLGNKAIKTVGELGSAFGEWGQSIAEMGAALSLGALAFKGLKAGAEKGIGMLGRLSAGAAMREQRKGYFTGGIGATSDRTIAGQISNPIVNAINRIGTLLTGKEFSNQGIKDRSNLLKDRRAALYGLMSEKTPQLNQNGREKYKSTPLKFSASDVSKQLSGLTKEEQQALYRSMPSLSDALRNNYTKAFSNYDLSDQAKKDLDRYFKGLDQQVQSGQSAWKDVIEKGYNPAKVAQEIGNETGKEINKAIFSQMKIGLPEAVKNGEKQGRKQLKSGKKIVKGIIDPETGEKTSARAPKATSDRIKQSMAGGQAAVAAQKVAEQSVHQLTKTQAAVTNFSNATSGAGQAIMGLGMAMSASGFGAFGSVITTIGSGIMGLGVAAEGAVSGVTALKAALAGVGLSVAPLLAAAAGVAAIAGGVIYLNKKHKEAVSKIQKDSKDVVANYEKSVEKTTKNINTLNDAKADFARLSEGVDSNGNNIDLGTEEYADYLKIVNEVAKMHPELVKGYNAHGQAILKNNKAVEEAIKAEEKAQKTAEKNFASEESLDKLIAGRNLTKRWAVGQDKETSTWNGYTEISHHEDSKLKQDSQAVIDSIKKLENGEQILSQLEKDFHLETGSLVNLTDEGIKAIQQHGSAMVDQVKNEYGDADDELTRNLVKDVQNSIAKVGKDTEGIEEVVEPIYKSLSTYASQEGLFDNIPDEFREAAEAGLKEVAKMSIDPETKEEVTGSYMQKRAQEIGQEISNLNGHADEYSSILESMEEAQQQYSKSLDESKYFTNIADEISSLAQWRDEALRIYKNEGDESQRILAESLQNQIEAYENFTTEGTKTLADGLNEQADQLEKASTAAENFQKKTEGINDYYTGADNMKSILDDIKDGIDDVGKGSRTFWAGAEELLGEEFVKNNSFSKVNKQLGTMKDMFYDANGEIREGQETAEKFMDYLQGHQNDKVVGDLGEQFKNIKDILNVTDEKFDFEAARGLDADQFNDLAESLGMSDQLLASMLNQAAQFNDIDFSNANVLREALATGEGSIGTDIAHKSGNNLLYTRRSTFEAEAKAEGYTPPELKNLEKQLKDKGVKLLADAGEMGTEQLKGAVKNMGMDSAKEFVSGFSELGYGRDEIKTLYDKALAEGINGKKLGLEEGQTFNDLYSEFLRDRADESFEEDKSVEEGISDNTARTASAAESINAAVGGLDVGDRGLEGQEKEGYGYKALEKILGGKGADTKAQYFASGLDKKGNKFVNETDYYNTLNQLSAQKQKYEEKYAQAMTAAQNTTDADAKLGYERQAKYYNDAAAYLGKYIQMGEEAHKKTLENNQKETQSDNATAKNKQDKNKEDIESTRETQQEKQELISEEAAAKAKALANQALAPGEDAETAREKTLQQIKDLGVSEKELQQIQGQMNSAPSPFSNLIKSQDLENFNNFKNNVNTSQQSLTKLDEKADSIKFSGIKDSAQEAFKEFKKDTQKAQESVKDIGKEKPKVEVKAESKEVDKIEEKTKKLEKEKVTIPVEAKANVEKAGAQIKKDAQQTVQNKGDKTTQQTSITLQSTITNPDEPKQKIDNAMPKSYKKTVKASITMSASVNAGNLAKQMSAAASGASKGIKVKAGATSTVTAKTKGLGDVKSLDNAIKTLKGKSVKVSASVSGATQVNSLKNAISNLHDKTVTVTYKQKGKPGNSGSVGIHNYIQHQAPVQANSLAEGNSKSGRRKVNNFKGGLTLTGEKGFEIAWLPSENRSMILGTQGPQMVSLPRDAVVWTNEQSKKIMKQKAIPAQSMVGGSGTRNKYVKKKIVNNDDSGGNNGGGGGGNDNKHHSSHSSSGSKTHWIRDKNDGKVSVKIYNIEKKIEQVKKKQEQIQKQINKALEKASTTLSDIAKLGNEDIKRLQQSIKLNQKLVTHYNNQLKKYEKNNKKSKVAVKWEEKKYRVNKKGQYVDEKGKKTSKKKATKTVKKNQKIKLGQFIDFDPDTGAYQINQKALNKVKGKSKKKAIRDAAQKKIDDNTSKRDSAESAVNDAKEKLEELGKQLYETFHGWENELTKIYDLTKQIEGVEKQTSRFKEAQTLQDEMLSSGLVKATDEFIKRTTNLFRGQLSLMIANIKKSTDLIAARQEDVLNKYSSSNIREEAIDVSKFIAQAKEANTAQAKAQSTEEAANKAEVKVYEDEEAKNKGKKVSKKTSVKKEKAKIKKANKVLDNKNASKKQKKKAKAQVKKAKNNIKTIKAGKTASKNYEKDMAAAEKARDAATIARQEFEPIKNNTRDETVITEAEARLAAVQERLKAIAKIQEQNLVNVTANKDGTFQIDFNEEKLEELKNSTDPNKMISSSMYEEIKKYVDELNEANSELIEAYSNQTAALAELYSTLTDLKEEYADASETILSGLEDEAEKQADNLEKISSALTDALKDLLDEVKRRLDQHRQQEDNRKKEEEIGDKQRRLAALRADTSGGNQKEIKQLEKEIAEAQQNYGRELEDQQLQKLQDQADQAAQQRERQIQLLNAQLEVAKTNGTNLEEVKRLLAAAQSEDEETRKAAYEQIRALWEANNNFQELTEQRQAVLEGEFQTLWANISGGLQEQIKITEKAITDTNTELESIQTKNEELANSLATTDNKVDGVADSLVTTDNKVGGIANSLATTDNKVDGIANLATTMVDGEGKLKIGDVLAASPSLAAGIENLKELDIDDETIKSYLETQGIDIAAFRTAQENASSILETGIFSVKDLAEGGYTAKELQEAGVSIQELKDANVDTNEILKAGFSIVDLLKNQYTAVEIQKATAASAQDIQKAVNEAQQKQSAMAGVKTKVDVNGSKSGGSTSATLNNTGTKAVANKGSKLYTQTWDSEEGKVTGKVKETPIDKLTEAQVKTNQKEATDAIISAIKNKKVGSKINDNWNKLIAASDTSRIVGKEFKLENGKTGVVGKTGHIYYKKDGSSSHEWNPKKGTLGTQKTAIGTIKKKPEKYKTGGLNTSTGPAWLDGTPAKPELVLNAQDTKNFLALKDILGKTLSATDSFSGQAGDFNCEINISVDHINNDYDVDKIAARIKKDIVKDAGYRNVTRVRNFR